MKPKEISFYRLGAVTLEKMLPALLEKIYQKGLRAMVVLDSPERVAAIDSVLWTYSPGSFLPHGSRNNFKNDPQDHPIWLTTEYSNRSQAQVAVITTGETIEDLGDFERCIDIFDGSQANATEQALIRLENYRRQGHSTKFWEQTPENRWAEKQLASVS